ncbi:MAG: NADH-quinone oxidoreductase subunit N, partial [Gammaproteobacteria bacterium]|nr:NADH-quinone oxidoreductase subunit N [Gammaproteobacteria bacterium]NIR94053.1 NADH-quinone oxidoreductase subunit N [Gammaproteobacteria bacterium]
CLVLVADLFVKEKSRVITLLLSLLALVVSAVLTLQSFDLEQKTLVFSGTFVRDPMGDVLKLFIYVVVFMVFVYSQKYLKDRNLFKGEYYILGLFGTLGMMIMVSAHNLLTVYLGLELLSLSMYAMVAMHRDSLKASEAGMKYFLLGAMASGMLLYGMSLIYGLTGSLDLTEIHTRIFDNQDTLVQIFALSFIIVGIAFKLGAVPFHMWVPDVYHGAPTAMTMYIGSAPKIAAFAMLMRLLVDGLQGLHGSWQDMLAVL